MTSFICGIEKEMIPMSLQNRNRLSDLWMGEGIVWELGMDMYTLLYLKWTYCAAQCYVEARMGVEFGGRVDTCVCG